MRREINCPGCGLCIEECTRGLIVKTPRGVAIDPEGGCNRCGHCVAVCPQGLMENPLSPKQEEIERILTPHEAVQFLRTPRSVRHYKEEPISRSEMLQLLDIGRYPQTGSNRQGISFLVLEGRDKIQNLNRLFCETVEAAGDDPSLSWIRSMIETQRTLGKDTIFRGCPDLILALADQDFANGRENAQFSLTFIALLAPSMGLGTCWAGIFERMALDEAYCGPFLEFLQVPEGKRIRGAMMAGYPAVHFKRLVARDPLCAEFR